MTPNPEVDEIAKSDEMCAKAHLVYKDFLGKIDNIKGKSHNDFLVYIDGFVDTYKACLSNNGIDYTESDVISIVSDTLLHPRVEDSITTYLAEKGVSDDMITYYIQSIARYVVGGKKKSTLVITGECSDDALLSSLPVYDDARMFVGPGFRASSNAGPATGFTLEVGKVDANRPAPGERVIVLRNFFCTLIVLHYPTLDADAADDAAARTCARLGPDCSIGVYRDIDPSRGSSDAHTVVIYTSLQTCTDTALSDALQRFTSHRRIGMSWEELAALLEKPEYYVCEKWAPYIAYLFDSALSGEMAETTFADFAPKEPVERLQRTRGMVVVPLFKLTKHGEMGGGGFDLRSMLAAAPELPVFPGGVDDACWLWSEDADAKTVELQASNLVAGMVFLNEDAWFGRQARAKTVMNLFTYVNESLCGMGCRVTILDHISTAHGTYVRPETKKPSILADLGINI